MTERERKANAEILEILERRAPDLARQIQGSVSKDIRTQKHEQRLRVVNTLGEELVEKGFQPDSEPNKYGLRIEDLIDFCELTKD